MNECKKNSIFLFHKEEGEPKTLAEVAKACADKEGPDIPSASPDKQQMTLAEAANVYQKMTPCKSQLEEVEVVTGEEKERNVMQVSKIHWTTGS